MCVVQVFFLSLVFFLVYLIFACDSLSNEKWSTEREEQEKGLYHHQQYLRYLMNSIYDILSVWCLRFFCDYFKIYSLYKTLSMCRSFNALSVCYLTCSSFYFMWFHSWNCAHALTSWKFRDICFDCIPKDFRCIFFCMVAWIYNTRHCCLFLSHSSFLLYTNSMNNCEWESLFFFELIRFNRINVGFFLSLEIKFTLPL